MKETIYISISAINFLRIIISIVKKTLKKIWKQPLNVFRIIEDVIHGWNDTKKVFLSPWALGKMFEREGNLEGDVLIIDYFSLKYVSPFPEVRKFFCIGICDDSTVEPELKIRVDTFVPVSTLENFPRDVFKEYFFRRP